MRVAALGDSITEGYMCYPQDGWVNIVERELGIEIFNFGVCGDLTRNMHRRLRQQVLSINPSHCIILGGTNDAFYDMSLDDYIENMKVMIECCQENDIIPIIGVPTPCLSCPEESILQEYRRWLKEYAVSHVISIIDFHVGLTDTISRMAKKEYLLDEVHPNVKGYRIMADAAKDVLGKFI
ncbi:MAG: hypothetical protein APF84_06350 [Gracilibacter sp. BRH_c7a]|nr:MAG: hypothetical protein APF84_06350 [Gracilibacter sp. BRH_c7a]